MKDRVNHLNHEYINLTEVGDRIEVVIKIGLDLIMDIGVIQHITRTSEVGQGIILITEVVKVTMHEVIRDMGEIMVIIEGMIIWIEFMTGIGVGHLRDRIEVGEMIGVWVIVGQDQVLEQVQIETTLGVLNAGSMTILQGNVQQGKRVGRQSKYNRCLIWMKTNQYYRLHWWTQKKTKWL